MAFLGENIFKTLAQVYAQNFAPDLWDINLYGDRFSTLLSAQTQGAKADAFDWPLIATVAEIEYAISQVYYAREDGNGLCGPIWVEASSVHNLGEASSGYNSGEASPPGEQLQRNHLYARVEKVLDIKQPIAIWRTGIDIQVGNTP